MPSLQGPPSSLRARRRPSRAYNYRRIFAKGILGGALGGLGFGGGVFLLLGLLVSRGEAARRLNEVAHELAAACAAGGPDGAALQAVLRHVPWEDIDSIHVLGAGGEVVAALGPGGDMGRASVDDVDDKEEQRWAGVRGEIAASRSSGAVLVRGSAYPQIARGVTGLAILLGLLVLATPIAYGVSRDIYARFSGQVLDLVHVANAISARRDFSIRAVRRGEEEIGILVDTFNHMITQIELSEGQLRSEVERAEAAKLAKSQFLATMSHEIRTPINGIFGMIQLLRDTELSDEQKEYLSTILGSTEGLLAIINDILDFSKVEAGRMELEEIPFSMSEVLKGCLEPASILAAEKGLELCCEVEHKAPDRLIGDPARLRQILLNLTNNAIKFTSAGEIVVSVALVDDDPKTPTLRLEVRDSGIGIPPDRMDRLFKPFSQVEAAHNRTYGGTGLGLAICQKIVEAMGGEMFVRSKEGVGSVFGFVVQLGRDHARPKKEPWTPSGLSILAGDPNKTSLGILVRSVEEANAVVPVTSAEAVRREIERRDGAGGFDLFLLDFALAEELAKKGGALPAPLVVLAQVRKASEARALARGGGCSVVTKPVRRDDLLWCVCELLRPRAEPDAPLPAERGPVEEGEPTLLELSVLVAEDNPVNQRIITRFLDKLNVRWVLVADGRAALEAMKERKFDAVLMDVQMPVMDGMSATRAIRKAEAKSGDHTPVVAMTANAMEEDRRNCEEAGFDAHLPKPLRFEHLREFLLQRFGRRPAPLGAAAAPEGPKLELYRGRPMLGSEKVSPRREG